MKAFLQELAEQIYREPNPESITLVFPNRRASLYFRKYFSAFISKPTFSPRLITIEDFIGSMSTEKVPDKLELIHRLFLIYKKIVKSESGISAESFDHFYFWGDLLVKDFNELDKYQVNASQLFKDLSNQKKLDDSFDYLTPEQKTFLSEFWQNFDIGQSENKIKFLNVWNKLNEVYQSFRDHLRSDGLAYEGMLQREVVEGLVKGTIKVPNPSTIKMVGFNALTKVEEEIFAFLVARGAQVIWDGDEFYVNDVNQESGDFFREYQKHPVLGKTFPSNFPSHLRGTKNITVYGATNPVAQTKLMAQILKGEFLRLTLPADTLVVLPDEKLLMPVLHGISGEVDALNVTMGFPLTGTPVYNLIEQFIDLQISCKDKHFNQRHALGLLGHPLVVAADPVEANIKRKEILKNNWIQVPANFLAAGVHLHRQLFKPIRSSILKGLSEVLTEVAALDHISKFEREHTIHFLKLLNRLEEVMGAESIHSNPTEAGKQLRSFLRLFRQVTSAEKIPFTGEPLKGLQIMGVLETRNLDFKNIFILSLNEGIFPSAGNKGTYLPFNVRKAYGLPTAEHQNAIYAYLFYRNLQRAENIHLFYNTESDPLEKGEMSRYLQQLIYESKIPLTRKLLHNIIQPASVRTITIHKDREVMESLKKLNEGTQKFKGISPSALNNYVECPLRFYLKHIAGIKEPREIQEDVDALVIGNFLHKVMEYFYQEILDRKNSFMIEKGDFDEKEAHLQTIIDRVFKEVYHVDLQSDVVYEGQHVVLNEVLKFLVKRILIIDEQYAPFEILGLEWGIEYKMKIDHDPGYVVLRGKIDRIDRKDNVVRIVDYKTGKDSLKFNSFESLFEVNHNRNKAAFQIMIYALMYQTEMNPGEQLAPGLITRSNLFENDFKYLLVKNKIEIDNVELYINEFHALLHNLLNEIFDPLIPFSQTTDFEFCKYCLFKQICYKA